MNDVHPVSDSLLEYGYHDAAPGHTQAYLMPAVQAALVLKPAPARVFDLGCGNGANVAFLAQRGYSVAGVDASTSGIAIAAKRGIGSFAVKSAYDALASDFGQFDVCLCLEVIEHLYDPRAAARSIAQLVRHDGIAVLSTPYHGYLKNLAISLVGGWDRHHSPLWDGGHIKFWSRTTLRQLFSEVGMEEVSFRRVGRVPVLAKSMVLVFRHGPGALTGRPAELLSSEAGRV